MDNSPDTQTWMHRCLQLAKLGRGHASPNPLVGSVIVADNRIIGEGWHARWGSHHGEVSALNNVAPQDRHLIKGASVYVNLEPCAHEGKTPSCAKRLVAERVKEVFIGTLDPDPRVAGNGVRILNEAGIDTHVGILSAQCMYLNRFFMSARIRQRPWITLKWAETADGIIGNSSGAPVRISNALSNRMTHSLRAAHMAIAVGGATLLQDNPGLDVRFANGPNPLRVLIADRKYIPDNYKALKGTEDQDYIYLNEPPEQLAAQLHKRDINSLLVEGGARTLQRFIDAGIWDEAIVYRTAANAHSSWEHPVAAPSLPVQFERKEKLGDKPGEKLAHNQVEKLGDNQVHYSINPDSLNWSLS